jgi:4-oxalomesaconate tautomerase
VLGAVSVLTAVLIDGAVGHELLVRPGSGPFAVEHPSGALQVEVELGPGDPPTVRRSTVIRTARPLFDGRAFPRP